MSTTGGCLSTSSHPYISSFYKVTSIPFCNFSFRNVPLSSTNLHFHCASNTKAIHWGQEKISKQKTKEAKKMLAVRNSDNHLVCMLDEITGTVEIRIKGCITLIERTPDGEIRIINTKTAA
jgi:hypothetical protein